MPEQATNSRPGSGRALLVIILFVILLIPVGYSVIGGVNPRGTTVAEPFLERPAAVYDTCVKDTEYMRWHHWELLRQVREEIVRYGERGGRRYGRPR